MELCVRSQDRSKLIKVYDIWIDDTDMVDKGYVSIIANSNFSFELGVYKTKERALEVLNEIQEARLGNFHYKCPSNVKVSIKEDTIVYEMPKE